MMKLGLIGIALSLAVTAGCKAGPTDGAQHRGKAVDPPAATLQAQAAAPRVGNPEPRVVAPTPHARVTGESWNGAQIDWVDYDHAIARAKTQHKPVCLVFFATWCPHCKNYSHVFEDPRVVGEAKKFVMVHIDVDQHPDLSKRYSLDGTYIPRTYFLSPAGNVAQNIRAPRERFQYFYDEHDATSLLAGMQKAEKLVD